MARDGVATNGTVIQGQRAAKDAAAAARQAGVAADGAVIQGHRAFAIEAAAAARLASVAAKAAAIQCDHTGTVDAAAHALTGVAADSAVVEREGALVVNAGPKVGRESTLHLKTLYESVHRLIDCEPPADALTSDR